MKVFLSWSGEPAKMIALVMRDLIDMLCKGVDPWVSAADIQKGARWGAELARELSTTNVGIIILTPYNLKSEWLLFESGALSKSVKDGHVHPLLVGLGTESLPNPLAQFQATIFRRDDVRDLLVSLASATSKPGSQGDLYRRFDEQWPFVEKKVADALAYGAALAIAQSIDSTAAAERSTKSQKQGSVEELTLNADHMEIMKFLAGKNGVKQPPTSIAEGLQKNYERIVLHIEELEGWGYVSESFSPAIGPVFGLDTKGRKLALQFGWI
ncbi:MAG: TIR domain-containing protein [Ralstonia sp.]|uniref:TIR domain-containing protein n=1 Tax=Ralstonia sp. TaxID=54061 RepID=UPI003F7D0E76